MGNLPFRAIHLDFHTSEKIKEVGEQFDADKFAQTLKNAHVESINLFARCHHGQIYYDTKLSARHPGLKRNLLMEQVDACKKVGIKTPIYITVGWDEWAANNHPEWVERRSDGKAYGTTTPDGTGEPLLPGWKTLCFNTPYVDYLEQQTLEVLNSFKRKCDGLWFDIVWQDPCCCTYCLASMEKEGLDASNEKDRAKFANSVVHRFKRRMFNFVRNQSDCPVFFNEGHIGPHLYETLDCYTHLEIESLGSGEWGYDHFPITVRYAKNLGKEYLAMTGKFHKSWADFGGFKNQPAMEYECFGAIAHGAKCSIGDQLHPSGEINQATYKLIESVYSQIEKKEPWCDDVRAVTEIAIFTPQALSGGGKELPAELIGAYKMLEQEHYQFDIIDDTMDFSKYKLIILPDVITLTEYLKAKVQSYLLNGGKLIASYQSGLNTEKTQFALSEIGAKYIGQAEYSPDYILAKKEINEGLLDTDYVMYDRALYVQPVINSEILANIIDPYFNREFNHFCSHCHTPANKPSEYPAILKNGNVIYFSHPVFAMYNRHGVKAYKLLVKNAINMLMKEKILYTNAPTSAHINVNYQFKEDRHIAHILHYIPERRCLDLETIEDVIPLYNIHLILKLETQPINVYCAPSMQKLEFEYIDGYVKTVVPEVVGHQIIVFEN